MDLNLKNSIKSYLSNQATMVGFAPSERFETAPEKHHPERICKGAKTVIVFASAVPRGVMQSPEYDLHTMHRSYHTVYSRLDDIALDLSTMIEAQGEYLAVPVPSYAPMVFHGMEPWGLLSLKHAAENAGLGKIGKNGLLHNPEYGTMLRFGAVVTDAPLPGDDMIDMSPCPEKCGACHKACPSKAFDESGNFSKLTCLGHTIKHAMYPIALSNEQGLKNIEQVINTAGYNYWVDCNRCVAVCPNNRPRKGDNKIPA